MEFTIPIGAECIVPEVVSSDNIASKYGSGMVEVFATPAMVALMEKAAMIAVRPFLPEGYSTVGVEVCVKHTKATPIGMEVWSKAVLKEMNGKRLTFEVTAWDANGEIGTGTHIRYIIDSRRFMEKIAAR